MNTLIPTSDEDNASMSEEKNDSFQGVAIKEPVPEGPRRTSTLQQTFVAQKDDKSTCGALYHIITYRKFAALQFLWLLICLSSFLFYALMQLYVAIQNERDENYPEILDYVTDYGAEDSSREYKMPYIYISFVVYFVDKYYPDDYDYDFDFGDLDYETRVNIEEAANNIVDDFYYQQNFQSTAEIVYREETREGGIFEEVEAGHGQLFW